MLGREINDLKKKIVVKYLEDLRRLNPGVSMQKLCADKIIDGIVGPIYYKRSPISIIGNLGAASLLGKLLALRKEEDNNNNKPKNKEGFHKVSEIAYDIWLESRGPAERAFKSSIRGLKNIVDSFLPFAVFYGAYKSSDYFYSYLGEFTSFTNAQAGSVAEKLGNTIPPAYDMAVASGDEKEVTERVKTITIKSADRLAGIAGTGKALMSQHEGGNILTPAGKVQCDLYKRLRPTAVNTIANCVVAYAPIETKLQEIINTQNNVNKDEAKNSLLYLRRSRYQVADMEFRNTSATTERLIKPELIKEYAEKIHELDPSFEVPTVESKTNSAGGCYVATAVYGSYDCPEVWTLRRYRDNTLAETWYGRAFIRTYYAVSPTLVKLFGNTDWFKNMWKPKLDKMVERLNNEGVENTPYEDINW